MLNENDDLEVVETEESQTEEISQVEENPTETDNPSIDTEETKAKESDNTNLGKEFTSEQQARVNELVRTRLDRQRASFLKKYGVEDEEEFANLIGMQQSYSVMKERYEAGKNEIAGLNKKIAFMRNNIDPKRENDIDIYFKGLGVEFNDENFAKELAVHPEWLNPLKKDNSPKTTITTLGVGHDTKDIAETDEERMKRVFGLK